MTYLIIIILVGLSGIFSGLTIGFFSLNKDDLERKADLGDIKAKKVYSVRKTGNLLLCTLLIGNVAVNAAISLFLGSITSGLMAGFIATALIVVFGEIIPQASFSRYALEVGYRFVWLVRIFEIILLPICWPMAWGLDRALGEEMNTIYSKKELVKMIEKHEDLDESEIDEDEERIMKGVLSFSDEVVRDIMTPRVQMIAFRENELLTNEVVEKIKKTGHSRLPVYGKNRDDIVGILYVKDLIGEDIENKKIHDLMREDVIFVDHKKPLDDLLNEFKKNKKHQFIVLDEFGGVSGLVTIEDVIEEIINDEIIDEFDQIADTQKAAKDKLKNRNDIL